VTSGEDPDSPEQACATGGALPGNEGEDHLATSFSCSRSQEKDGENTFSRPINQTEHSRR